MTMFGRLHMPPLRGAEWLNSEPVGPAELRGRVVLVVSPEGSSVFLGLAGLAESALAWDDDGADAHLVQRVVDVLLTVAPVGSDGARPMSGAARDTFTGRGEPRCVCGAARF